MKNAVFVETLQDRILDALLNTSGGYTDFELSAKLGAFLSSVNSSRNALVRDGLVVAAEERRPSGRGGTATVWVVAA